jgi:hypothetical protein
MAVTTHPARPAILFTCDGKMVVNVTIWQCVFYVN